MDHGCLITCMLMILKQRSWQLFQEWKNFLLGILTSRLTHSGSSKYNQRGDLPFPFINLSMTNDNDNDNDNDKDVIYFKTHTVS